MRERDSGRGILVTLKIGRLRFDEPAADVLNEYRANAKRGADHAQRRIGTHLTTHFGGRRMSATTAADVRAYMRIGGTTLRRGPPSATTKDA